MGEIAHLRSTADLAWTRPRRSARSAAAGLVWALVSLAVMALGAVLAVVFAATLVVVMVLASLLLGLAAVGWRAQRRPVPRRAGAGAGEVIDMRRHGHAWVAYDWNRRAG